MRKNIVVFIALFLTGCSPIQQIAPASTPSHISIETQVPITPALVPTETVIATPMAKLQCPQENPKNEPPNFEQMETENNYSSMGNAYLRYLNSGGMVDNLDDKWKPAYSIDLTGDNMPELIVQELQPWHLFIYSCKNGKYQSLPISYETGRAEYPKVIKISDANRNGKPEIITLVSRRTMGVSGYDIFEWDGQKFSSIVYYPPESFSQDISGGTPLIELQVIDLDASGTDELVWKWEEPLWTTYQQGLPLRKYTSIYEWNNNQFIFKKGELAPPEYRFQAVQDGDRATLSGEYGKAFSFYQQAISSDELDWWSLERRNYEQSEFPAIRPTPLPSILPDPNEYPNLAAYSWYRILLLNVVLGKTTDAKSVLDTLNNEYPIEQAGGIYTELANKFWKRYNAEKDIGSACERAITFANQYPEQVFKYIGYYYEGSNDYHGDDSHFFFPQYICPFQ